MREFNAKDANFLWRQIGRIDGVIETLNRTEGEMPEIIAGVLKRIRDDIDKFVDNKTKDYENIYKGVSDKHRRRQRFVVVFNNRFRLYVYSERDIGC